MPITTPSSQRRPADGRNASDGKLFASVDAGLLAGMAGEHLLYRADDRLDRGDGPPVSLKSFGTSGFARLHHPAHDLRRQLGVLGDQVPVRAIAALRAGEAVLDAHRPCVPRACECSTARRAQVPFVAGR
jgi:hypothetical protein